jgi:uncharacterized protein
VLRSPPIHVSICAHMHSDRSTVEIARRSKVSCATCRANCCKLEVILMGDDDVPEEYTACDRWDGYVMARLDDGWCAALNRDTMLCSIYENRPAVCREYELGGHDCLLERSKTGLAP